MTWALWVESNIWAIGQITLLATVATAAMVAAVKLWHVGLKPAVSWLRLPILMDVRLKAIEFQLSPNGGRSLCDHVTALDKRLSDVEIKVVGGIKSITSAVNRLRQVQECEVSNSLVPTLRFDARNSLVAANQPALELLRVTELEAAGHGWMANIHTGYVDRIASLMKSASLDIRPCHIDFVVVRSQSDGVSVTLRLQPMSEEGEFIGWYGSLRLIPVMQ